MRGGENKILLKYFFREKEDEIIVDNLFVNINSEINS